MGLTLKDYAIKLPKGVLGSDNFCKVKAYTRGDAMLFVRNVLEVRLNHTVFSRAGGLAGVKAFFADTNSIKGKLIKEIDNAISAINTRIEELRGGNDTGGESEGGGIITPQDTEEIERLESAKRKLEDGKTSVGAVTTDDVTSDGKWQQGSDFNAENIKRAKVKLAEGFKEASSVSVSSSSDDDSSTISVSAIGKTINNDLHFIHKLALEKFEEKYGAEIHIGTYHKYEYAIEFKDICEWLEESLKKCGLKKFSIDPSKYNGAEALEAAIKVALNNQHIEYKCIEVEEINTDYEPVDEG